MIHTSWPSIEHRASIANQQARMNQIWWWNFGALICSVDWDGICYYCCISIEGSTWKSFQEMEKEKYQIQLIPYVYTDPNLFIYISKSCVVSLSPSLFSSISRAIDMCTRTHTYSPAICIDCVVEGGNTLNKSLWFIIIINLLFMYQIENCNKMCSSLYLSFFSATLININICAERMEMECVLVRSFACPLVSLRVNHTNKIN